MPTISDTPPRIEVDRAELLKWGYIWRVGTKTRSGRNATAAEPEAGEAEANEESSSHEETEAVVQPGIVNPSDIGMPADLAATIRPDKKFPNAFEKAQQMAFGSIFDNAVGRAVAAMLGGLPIVTPGSSRSTSLQPEEPNCVEVGPVRVVGGIRPQNFDVGYRPDGVRFAFDSKTLNDTSSIRKNWQNMVNDLGTEATTVHTRFPYAVVAFMVVIPRPALMRAQELDLIRTLERLGSRNDVLDQAHLAEAISLVIWNPETGEIDPLSPAAGSPLRIEVFMERIHRAYVNRYKGLPPHDR